MSSLKLQLLAVAPPNARVIFGSYFDVFQEKISLILTILRLLNDLKWGTVCVIFLKPYLCESWLILLCQKT
jgi:hypothetical protein